MRKLRLVICIASTALVMGTPAATTRAAAARPWRDVTIPLPPGVHVSDARVRVLLPAGYATSHERYPVLYLLHGAGDRYTSWTTRTRLVRLARALGLIVVMPDGGHGRDAGWYADWRDGSREWETFHLRVMIPYIDTHFRTLADRSHRAIAGLSMGGFGAMRYAALHPELFSAAASFSGALDPAALEAPSLAARDDGFPKPEIWGDPATARAQSPANLVAGLTHTTILLACGDGSKPSGTAWIEREVRRMDVAFARALDAAGIPHTDRLYAGDHTWRYWRDDLAWALPRIYAAIRSAR